MKIDKIIHPEAIVRLLDSDNLGDAAIRGGEIEMIVRIPVTAFGPAWDCLLPIMDDGTPWLTDWLEEGGRGEYELRLLCGLLFHLSDHLPMDTSHYLEWQKQVGVKQYLDDFARERVKALKKGQV